MSFFGTKAKTLYNLLPLVKKATILPILIIKAKDWHDKKEHIINEIYKMGFFDSYVAVRSSCSNEDSYNNSMAGKYTSILNAYGKKNIINAIDIVIKSYETILNIKGTEYLNNEVFIQPMVKDVSISGVAFSMDPNNGANYIVINYDDITGLTDTITSGKNNTPKSLYYFKKSKVKIDDRFSSVLDLILELEKILDDTKLDIEFAIDKNNNLYLLQVRPLLLNCEVKDISEQEKLINNIFNKIKLSKGNKPYLYGNKTAFGVMPDWNPAEIIGIKPKPLALSLYKDLITDNIWSYQRDNYGYKNLKGFPLIISILGMPYVDIRVSFNSFLPKQLDDTICEKLINYYINSFIKKPENHDKVEFEIVHSCYTFDIKNKLNILSQYGFDISEINSLCEGLNELTNKIIDKKDSILITDINKISSLDSKRRYIINSNLDTASKIYWLLEDCRQYGTLPFAGIARSAFIAIEMIKSLISIGIISNEEYNQYIRSLNTISSTMQKDYLHLNKQEFISKYGHLRPGTYDILSLRYDENPELYFDFDKSKTSSYKNNMKNEIFKLSLHQLNQIDNLLNAHKINCNVLELFDFFKTAIEGREYSKFIFTQSLSDILFLIGKLFEQYGFTREDAAYSQITTIKEISNNYVDIKSLLHISIQEGKKNYENTKGINLPVVILKPSDVFTFKQLTCMPNYITLKKAIGKNMCIDENIYNIDGCIVCIKSADPGYDWIFSKGILGFITMYGGVNSHMAIRAGELGIPAVIGVGEEFYNKIKKVKTIELNCSEKVIRVLE